MSNEPGDRAVFVERTFEAASGDIVCRFYRPRPDGENFRCDYEIAWPDRRRARYAMGVDSAQALVLAMEVVHADLLSSPERKAGGLTWLGQQGLGLPLSEGLRDLIEE